MNLAIGSRVISSTVYPEPIGTFKENVTLVFSYEKVSSVFFFFLFSSSPFFFYYPLGIQLLKNIMFFPLFVCLCSTLGGGGGVGREGGLSCFYCFVVVVFQSLLLTLVTICFEILRTWKESLFHIVSFGILRRSKSKHFKLFLRKSAN